MEAAEITADFAEENQAAKAFGWSVRTLRRRMKEPDGLPFVKSGRKTLIHIPTARKWLFSREVRPNPTD